MRKNRTTKNPFGFMEYQPASPISVSSVELTVEQMNQIASEWGEYYPSELEEFEEMNNRKRSNQQRSTMNYPGFISALELKKQEEAMNSEYCSHRSYEE
ncbi:hypothetical protein ENUP19_0126G0041 [Entamoeba nuttalli]|uniref:Uncharacterized protein n=1 Tax=Entamoeba nuttalli TaxID=412467 RepID=A0ABQ0DJF7_9EUKA